MTVTIPEQLPAVVDIDATTRKSERRRSELTASLLAEMADASGEEY